jgi:hypothetical protein
LHTSQQFSYSLKAHIIFSSNIEVIITRRRLIVLIVIFAVLLPIAIGILLFFGSSPTLEIELNPVPPLTVTIGENFSVGISVRNVAGFLKPKLINVRGELQLPEGFIDESLQTNTRQLVFGTISPGDASHYGLTIVSSSAVDVGKYFATLTVWGANVPQRALDIEIIVTP